jgi:hypothetical protein
MHATATFQRHTSAIDLAALVVALLVEGRPQHDQPGLQVRDTIAVEAEHEQAVAERP